MTSTSPTSSPVAQPGQYFTELLRPVRHCHAGYLELSKYYIQWYKTGRQPGISRDGLFYFYRVHPKGAQATLAKPTTVPAGFADPSWMAKPVTDQLGDVQDNLYLTTMLTAPAELRVTSGDTQTRYPMSAGIAHIAVPFHPGAQHFELYRQGKCLLTLDGEPVQAQPDHYNFFPTTGFGYAK